MNIPRKLSRWKRVLIVNASLTAALLSIVFLCGEVYYRFVYDTTDSFAFTLTCRKWFRRHYAVNLGGFRDNVEYRCEIAPGKRRITFLGDSFAAGHGVADVNNRFANIIREEHPEWEVHVLAAPGADTGREYRMLTNALANGYQLDTVVLVYVLNDAAEAMPQTEKSYAHIREVQSRGGWLCRHSYFANTIYFRAERMFDPELSSYFDYVRAAYEDGPVWDRHSTQLLALKNVVESHGGKLSVVTFPFLHSADYKFQCAHDRLGAFWASNNVPHLDLLPVFRGLDPKTVTVNAYDAHPNEHAHKLAAKEIERWLSSLPER